MPTDLSLAQLAAIRAATTMPLDIYIEVPDDIGGFIRHYEIAEIVRAPVYLKFGLRNAPNIYPGGTHLESTAKCRAGRVSKFDTAKRLNAVMSPLPEAIAPRGALGSIGWEAVSQPSRTGSFS